MPDQDTAATRYCLEKNGAIGLHAGRADEQERVTFVRNVLAVVREVKGTGQQPVPVQLLLLLKRTGHD